jgi:glyoxylase-like metal-dependent hydrolase (beta-lactamase superfamily II)
MTVAALPHLQDQVALIDCHYLAPEHVAAFLMVQDGRGAFVDNGVTSSVPHLLAAAAGKGLAPEDIDYIIVTHVHLDHAGGTSALLDACPNATILAHERAARHIIDPSRLIKGSLAVYGQEFFDRVFGTIHGCDANRVQVVKDGETIDWHGRGLRFLYTLGHCSHHAIIHDLETNGVFTGDALGICHYRLQTGHRPFVLPAATPTEFDVAWSKQAVETILATGCERLFVAHYGQFEGVAPYAESVFESLERFQGILDEAVPSGLEGEALQQLVEKRVRIEIDQHLLSCGVEVTAEMREALEVDVRLDSAGLTHAALRLRREGA